MENWRDLCSVVHKGSPSFAVMREDGHVIEANSFEELIEAIKNDAKMGRNSKTGIVWITRNGKKIPIRGGRMPNGRAYEPQIGSVIRVRGSSGEVINYTVVSGADFKRSLDAAKATVRPEAAWRVDNTHSAEDYKGVKLFVTQHGSTIAIKPNGDIISVCKKRGDVAKGDDLLKFAVANGGTKLDSFIGNFEFYCDNGFEPVSWTRFVEDFAPHDWVKTRDLPEKIVFFKYTGKKTSITSDVFIDTVPESIDYDVAQLERDRSI